MRKVYVRVKTADLKRSEDMVRYIGYRSDTFKTEVSETPAPQRVALPYGGTWVAHRFQDGEYTYFMRPNGYTDYWQTGAVDRWRSFGVTAEIVKREA